ncbi:hypothetical protein SLA2020_437760 [Shorea laevis]
MGFQFAGKAVYSAVWVAVVSLFMELLGFSTQKWLTAGGLGTVLLTLAGREIFTNFLSSAMIHATRPFVVNEWIQTKIEGYEVSGTVEHVGWWSPTIVRGEDREAVHIPNHMFTVNVVRNLTQTSHLRIKTHLAISHLDVNNLIVLSLTCAKSWQRIHKLSNRGCTEECFWKMLILKTRLFCPKLTTCYMSMKVLKISKFVSFLLHKKCPSRKAELESQVFHFQEELKKTHDQLSLSESRKKQALQDDESKKQLLAHSLVLKGYRSNFWSPRSHKNRIQ